MNNQIPRPKFQKWRNGNRPQWRRALFPSLLATIVILSTFVFVSAQSGGAQIFMPIVSNLGSGAAVETNQQMSEPDPSTQMDVDALMQELGVVAEEIEIIDEEPTTDDMNALAATGSCWRPTLRLGNFGESVRYAQNQLLKTHERVALYIHNSGGADGHFGKGTWAAVYTYQKMVFPSQAAEWDGIIGPKTWEKLGCYNWDVPIVPTDTPRLTATPTRRATATPTRHLTATPTRRATSTPTRRATATPTRKPTDTPSHVAHDCLGKHFAKTGVSVDVTVRFECRYPYGDFEILYNAQQVLERVRYKAITDPAVIEDLARDLQEAYDTYSSWGLKEPNKQSNDLIRVSIGGAWIPDSGLSRQNVIQLIPKANDGGASRDRFGLEFVYHEVFHQFQWAYTDDDASYIANQGFFESMAEYAARRGLGRSPCDNTHCINELGETRQEPWDPPYHGEYFFHWANKVRRPNWSDGVFFEKLLTEFEKHQSAFVPDQDVDIEVFRNLLGNHSVHHFRTWTLSDAPQRVNDIIVAQLGSANISSDSWSKNVNSTKGHSLAYVVNHRHNQAITIKRIGRLGNIDVSVIHCAGAVQTFTLGKGASKNLTLKNCTRSYLVMTRSLVNNLVDGGIRIE